MDQLANLGLRNLAAVHRNLSTPALYEQAIERREGLVAHLGPLVVRTGEYTGRSAQDKFIVEEPSSASKVWWGKFNQPIDDDRYQRLKARLFAYLQGREVYVQDCYAGADETYRLPVRVVTELAWHNLFARNLLIRELDRERLAAFEPGFTIVDCPGFHAIPELDGTRSEVFVLVNFAERLVIIGGTSYGGEIKKSVFTIMNYLLPDRGVFPMHCSANVGPDGDSAIFFGLSGTGKTTLSAEGGRALVGDDEHGWSAEGVFNFEGGCYAKVIRLNPDAEPEIYETTRRFGTVLENVAIDAETRRIDLDDASFTENTRAAYPITHLPRIVQDGLAPSPRNVIMLTADAFGVLPPISRLTPEQAMYHFISGYTAKVAGTERGVTEPQTTFSPAFGGPFMARHPAEYAELFGTCLREHAADCWLVNTGWTGGPYGVGERISIGHSRAVVRAAVSGALRGVEFVQHPVFGVAVPTSCPDVPSEVLDPRSTWADQAAYDAQARDLARRFAENFDEYADQASPEIAGAGPRVD